MNSKVEIEITEDKIGMRDKGSSFNFYERKIKDVKNFEDVPLKEVLNKMFEMYRGKFGNTIIEIK